MTGSGKMYLCTNILVYAYVIIICSVGSGKTPTIDYNVTKTVQFSTIDNTKKSGCGVVVSGLNRVLT